MVDTFFRFSVKKWLFFWMKDCIQKGAVLKYTVVCKKKQDMIGVFLYEAKY